MRLSQPTVSDSMNVTKSLNHQNRTRRGINLRRMMYDAKLVQRNRKYVQLQKPALVQQKRVFELYPFRNNGKTASNKAVTTSEKEIASKSIACSKEGSNNDKKLVSKSRSDQTEAYVVTCCSLDDDEVSDLSDFSTTGKKKSWSLFQSWLTGPSS
jgi:hypothetical protein